MRKFDSLSEREILALAISLEEEDERIYADYAEGLRQDFPASATVFDGMREEESSHRRRPHHSSGKVSTSGTNPLASTATPSIAAAHGSLRRSRPRPGLLRQGHEVGKRDRGHGAILPDDGFSGGALVRRRPRIHTVVSIEPSVVRRTE